jgi:hypothetical protein
MNFNRMFVVLALVLVVVAAALALYTANRPVAAAVDGSGALQQQRRDEWGAGVTKPNAVNNLQNQALPQLPVRYETPDEGQSRQARPKPSLQGSNGRTVSEWAAESSALGVRDHIIPSTKVPNRIQKDDVYVPVRPTKEFHRGEWMIP